jgi:hypothetical protein
MYCDGCGAPITSGGQYCSKCGKAILPGGAATASAEGQGMGHAMGQGGGPAVAHGAAAGATDGRVRRNLRTLATLWMINGILRLAGVAWMMLFGRIFLPFLRSGGGGVMWPLGGRWGWDIPFLGGLFSLSIVLAFFGVLHLVLAWGLFEGSIRCGCCCRRVPAGSTSGWCRAAGR